VPGRRLPRELEGRSTGTFTCTCTCVHARAHTRMHVQARSLVTPCLSTHGLTRRPSQKPSKMPNAWHPRRATRSNVSHLARSVGQRRRCAAGAFLK
jgi:hypothetical protein